MGNDWSQRKKQFLMVGGAIMVSVGFMFGIAANLSGMAPEAPQNQDPGEIEAEMPESTYSETSYGLGVNEQTILAFENEVIFVNAIYEEERPDFEFLKEIEEEFDGRVYVNYEESTESQFPTAFQIEEFPAIVVVGDRQTERGPYIDRPETTREGVRNSICDGMRNHGDAAAICF